MSDFDDSDEPKELVAPEEFAVGPLATITVLIAATEGH
jgi:hypothetical protein